MTLASAAPCGERGAGDEKAVGSSHLQRARGRRREGGGEFAPAESEGPGRGEVPGPALSVRLSSGHALPTVKSPIPELLSEGGSESRSRLTTNLRSRGFAPVIRMWPARERALKMTHVLTCKRASKPVHATRSRKSARTEAS